MASLDRVSLLQWRGGDNGTEDDRHSSSSAPTNSSAHSSSASRSSSHLVSTVGRAVLLLSAISVVCWLLLALVPRSARPLATSQPDASSTVFAGGVSGSSCLVMGAGTGYHWQQLYVFLRSFRLHCPDCQLVLFVDRARLTSEDLQLYRLAHAQLIDATALVELYPNDSLHGGATTHIASSRWQLYYDYLRALPQFQQLPDPSLFPSYSSRPNYNPITADMVAAAQREAYQRSSYKLEGYEARRLVVPQPSTVISHVFFTDLRDVYWQGNVFSWLPYRHQFEHDDLAWGEQHRPVEAESEGRAESESTYSGLWVFSEEVWSGSNKYNNEWTDCADSEYKNRHRSKPVLCSGTVLASYEAALHYLSAMQHFMLKHARCTRDVGGFDQGAHQMLIHDALIPHTAVYVVPSSRGPVGTVGIPLVRHPDTLHFSVYGDLINDWNETYAVVHQYDRGEALAKRVRQQFPFDQVKLAAGRTD